MSEDKKLRWLLAAAGKSQVAGGFDRRAGRLLYKPIREGFEPKRSAPFFREAFAELKPLLTPQWLFDNDKEGVLHDPDDNPVSKSTGKPDGKR